MKRIDANCERLGPGLWAKPVNALSNTAFLAALLMARRWRAEPLAPAPPALLAAIGSGSFVSHTLATP